MLLNVPLGMRIVCKCCVQKAIVLNYICYMFAKQVNASFPPRIDPIIIAVCR